MSSCSAAVVYRTFPVSGITWFEGRSTLRESSTGRHRGASTEVSLWRDGDAARQTNHMLTMFVI